jgi:hypothetical protein
MGPRLYPSTNKVSPRRAATSLTPNCFIMPVIPAVYIAEPIYTDVVKRQIWKVTKTFFDVDQFRGFCSQLG